MVSLKLFNFVLIFLKTNKLVLKNEKNQVPKRKIYYFHLHFTNIKGG